MSSIWEAVERQHPSEATSSSVPAAPPPVVPQRMVVVDVNMPFASMVGFMVKWSLAAIPAAAILFCLAAFFWVLLAAIGKAIVD